jgi:hypothetical protein
MPLGITEENGFYSCETCGYSWQEKPESIQQSESYQQLHQETGQPIYYTQITQPIQRKKTSATSEITRRLNNMEKNLF